MSHPSRPRTSIRLQPELLEDRLTPSITFGEDVGTVSGVGLGETWSVALGDFNGDGLEDAAIASYDQGVDIVMNEGYGNFVCTGHISIPSGAAIYIKTADVFDNGNVDLVVGCEWSNMVYVIPGNGDGTFGMPIPISIGSNIQGIATADLTGDGQQDILVATSNGTSVVLNNGNGTFAPPDTFPGAAESIAVGDFDGSGSTDFAVSLENTSTIDVYLNNGNGTFAAPVAVTCPDGYQPGSLTAGEFTNTGVTDLAVNYLDTAAIGVFPGNGDGTFQAPVWVNTGLSANSGRGIVEAADFDQDDNLDLAFDNNFGEVVIPGNGQGGFGTPVTITGAIEGYGSNDFAIGDLNGNGYPDIVNAGGFGVAFNLSGGSAINSFYMQAPATATVGQSFTLSIQADAAGNAPLITYTGTVDFNVVGQTQGVPGSAQFQRYNGGGGMMTVNVTPTAPGYLTIGVDDTLTPAATGSVTVEVAAAPALIDSGSSQVQAATTSDTSGAPDTVTVSVRNTSGGAVTGLATSDFAFAMLGGTSTGTFGPVTETSPGTYTAAFTGQTAGTAATVLVSVDGVPLATEPKITVTPGAADPAATTLALATPTVAFGASDVLTIVARDAAGNLVSGLTNSDFVVEVSSGTSTGTFGPVTKAAGAGGYTTTFKGLTAGDPSPVEVLIDGVEVAVSPMVEVTAGAPSGATSQVAFPGLGAPAGTAEPVTIVVADAHGNPVSGLSAGAFSFALSGGTSTSMFGVVSETGTPGTYTVPFTGLKVGTTTTLTLKVLGVTVTPGPVVIVVPGLPDPALTTVSVGSPTVTAGRSETVTIRVLDALGDAVGGLTSAEFSCALEAGTSGGTFGPVTPTTTPGVYQTTLVGTTAGTPSWLAVRVGGALLQSGPTVTVVPGPAAATSTATLSGSPLGSGTTEPLTVHVVDAEGNPVVGLSPKAFLVKVSGGQSTAATGSATPTATPGTYTIPVTGMKAGSASTVSVSVGGVMLTERPTVQVVPGAVSATASTVSLSKSTIRRYDSITITIRLRDAFGNMVTGLPAADFTLSMQGGGSGGDFGSVSETTTPGVYTASFTGYQNGTASSVIVEVLGEMLAQKPKVQVLN